MEAVLRKQKSRVRSVSNPTPAATISGEDDERTVVQGSLLPNVPREAPGTGKPSGDHHVVDESAEDVLLDTREDCHSPEPEELFDRPQQETW